MECFIKKVWQDRGKEAHSYFVRFSRGDFENRAVLSLQKTSKVKLKGSFEWANDFVKTVAGLADVKFSGIILSREDLVELQEFPKKKKAGIMEYNVSIGSEKIKEIQDRVYCMLLDGEAEGIILKIKKRLPKPGKGAEKKVDDKFCQLEADFKYWEPIKETFMLPECKKCKISHDFIIEELIIPDELKQEKDFAKIREQTRRKGKIIRKLNIDGQERKEEKSFEA